MYMPSQNFLVDVNLPKKFKFFNTEQFIHVVDINPKMKDSEVWDYALSNDLIILTKDSDFYLRTAISEHYPKIIYLQLGNQTLNQLHEYFSQNWEKIVKLIQAGNFILASKKNLELLF